MTARALGKALEAIEGDRALLKELVSLFVSDYPEKLAQIEKAIEDGDFKTIYETAHSLKGASGSLHLSKVYELALEIEKQGKEGKLDGLKETYKKLEQELKKFKRFVSQPGWEEKIR